MPTGFRLPEDYGSPLNYGTPSFGGGGRGGGGFPIGLGDASFALNPYLGLGLKAGSAILGSIFGNRAANRRRRRGEEFIGQGEGLFNRSLNEQFDPSLREEYLNRGVTFLKENLRRQLGEIYGRSARASGVRSGIAAGVAGARAERSVPSFALPLLEGGQEASLREFLNRRGLLANRAGQLQRSGVSLLQG